MLNFEILNNKEKLLIDKWFFSPEKKANNLSLNSYSKNEDGYEIFINVNGLTKDNVFVEAEEIDEGTYFLITTKEGIKNVFGKECPIEKFSFTIFKKVDLEKISVEVKEGLMKINVPILSSAKKVLLS